MNLKPILPAAALLVLLMPSDALSKNHHDFNDAGKSAYAQDGSLTPFSNVNAKNYLSGNIDQYSNGFDQNQANLGITQSGNYGNLSNTPYDASMNGSGYNLSNRANVHRHGGCNSPRSQMEQAMLNGGNYNNSLANSLTNPYSPAYNQALNNPNINPYANPNNNPYSNPYANVGATAYNGNINPYANPYANQYSNQYPNGYNGNNSFFNNATGANNLSRLGSVLSGSGLGANLGTYALNGNLNGGSLSGLRGLLGI